MKNKRQGLVIQDFSGGLLTKAPLVGPNTKYSPDCLDVYNEGSSLRKRPGVSTLNGTTVAGSPNGNGIFNWVVNATQQYIMALFGSTVKQMSLSGNTWSGSFSTISPDASTGTNLSDSILHHVTYSGNLIMTTENRDKPQVLTTTAVSYKNIDSGGVGTAPQCKYLQVWKTHLWMLNLGGGGSLTEDCDSITPWTDSDTGTGESTQTTFDGNDVFKMRGGTNSGDDAKRIRDVGTLGDDISVEFRAYLDTVGTIANGDYAEVDIHNGVIKFQTRLSDDGLEVYDGAAWKEVGVNTTAEGSWAIWKFYITGGTATGARVDVFKNNNPIGLQFYCANASAASDGQVDLYAKAGGSASRSNWYLDYLYINTISATTDYYLDGVFNSWVSVSEASYTDTPLPSSRPYTQIVMEDNDSTSSPYDGGSGKNTLVSRISVTTLATSIISNTGGKIGKCFNLTSASAHNVLFSTTHLAAINADTLGSIVLWTNPATLTTGDLVSFSNTTNAAIFNLSLTTDGALNISAINSAGTTQLNAKTTTGLITSANWNNIGVVQNGTAGPSVYINASTVTLTYVDSTNKASWLATMGTTMSSGFIGVRNVGGAGITNAYNGRVDDFRYYRTSLTAAEVKAIYAEGSGNHAVNGVLQETTTIYTGTYSYGVQANGYAVVSQTLSSGSTIAGTACLFGGWFNVASGESYKLRVDDGTATNDSSVLTGTGTWDYQSFSITPTSGAATVKAQAIFYGESNPEKTVLLIHGSGADASTSFIDYSIYNNTITAAGNAQVDTGRSKFGAASILLDGTGDYLSIPDATHFSFGTAPFAVEGQFYLAAAPTTDAFFTLFSQYQLTSDKRSFFCSYADSNGTKILRFVHSSDGVTPVANDITTTISTGTWHHIAITRSGSSVFYFVDGGQVGSTYNIGTVGLFNNDVAFLIGARHPDSPTEYFNGNIDEVRISAGTVRYNANFTAPTRPFMTAYIDQLAFIPEPSSSSANDLSDRLQRTAVASYNDFSGTDSGNNDIVTPGDVGLTGSGILNDKLYVFKKWSIHRVTYTGSTPLLDIKQAKSTVGTASPRTIKNIDVPGKGEVLIFLGTDRRIYLFDGYEVTAISDDISISNGISSVYMNNINSQALDKCWGVVHSNINWYELFIPLGSSSVPDYSIIVDFSGERPVFWPNSNRNFLSGNVSDNGAGQRVVYVQGNSNGQAYLTGSTTSDAGSAINSYWTSFKMGSPVVLGKIDEIEIQTDSVVCTPIVKWRMDWESTWISKTLRSSTYTHNYDPGRIDNLSQVYFSDNSTTASFKLWSISLYERALGGGK